MRNFHRVKADVSSGRLINREYGVMEPSQRRHLLATQMQNIMGLWREEGENGAVKYRRSTATLLFILLEGNLSVSFN